MMHKRASKLWTKVANQLIIYEWEKGGTRTDIQKLLLEKLGIERSVSQIDYGIRGLQEKGLIEHKRNEDPIERAKQIIPKEVVTWMCGLISCDGCVSLAHDKEYIGFHCTLVGTAEESWVKQIAYKLKKHHILYSLPHPVNGMHYVSLSNYDMLRLYKSIKYHKVENYIMKRKLLRLKEYLERMKLIA